MLAAALLLASIRLATPSPFNCPAFEPFRCPTEQRCIAIQVSIRNVISRLSNLPSARKYHQTPHMKLVFRHNQQQPVSHNYRPSPRNIIFIAYPLCYNHIYFIQFYIHISTCQYLCDGAADCSDGYDEDARLCTAARRPPVEETSSFLKSLLASHGPNYLEKLFGPKARNRPVSDV